MSNGLFTVPLDFGNQFPGSDRWLEIAVRTNGGGAFTTLAPRQPVLPMPYAIMANSASNLLGNLPAAQLSGTVPLSQLPANVITNGASGVNITGTFTGTGSGLTNLNYVAKTGDTMSGTLNLPANGLTAGGSQLVLANDNVGVGEASPQLKLDVFGSGYTMRVANPTPGGVAINVQASTTNVSSLGAFILWDVTSAGSSGISFNNINHVAHTADIALNTRSAGAAITVKDSGNVGIGTTSPGAALHVFGGFGNQLWLDNSGQQYVQEDFRVNGIQKATLYWDDLNRVMEMGTAEANSVIALQINGSTKFLVNANGNVGVGTASPQQKLDVVGNIGFGSATAADSWRPYLGGPILAVAQGFILSRSLRCPMRTAQCQGLISH